MPIVNAKLTGQRKWTKGNQQTHNIAAMFITTLPIAPLFLQAAFNAYEPSLISVVTNLQSVSKFHGHEQESSIYKSNP